MKRESAGGVVFDASGRVALVLQRDRRARLRWTLPKGRLDRGESPEEAALREVYEETGVVAKLVGVLGVYGTRRRCTYYFRMLVWRDHGRFDDETEEVRFVEPERALRLVRSRRDRIVLEWATAPSDQRRYGATFAINSSTSVGSMKSKSSAMPRQITR